jgi:hypothetical protein
LLFARHVDNLTGRLPPPYVLLHAPPFPGQPPGSSFSPSQHAATFHCRDCLERGGVSVSQSVCPSPVRLVFPSVCSQSDCPSVPT